MAPARIEGGIGGRAMSAAEQSADDAAPGSFDTFFAPLSQ